MGAFDRRTAALRAIAKLDALAARAGVSIPSDSATRAFAASATTSDGWWWDPPHEDTVLPTHEVAK